MTVRSHLVDATYMASQVPATHPAPFEVTEGVRMIPVGELAKVGSPPTGFVIVGAGKTALDAICWLLDRGTEPEDITWIRPQDSWLLNRAFFQPGQLRTFLGVVLQLESMVASESIQEAYERLEGQGVMLRTDPAVVPTMMKGATVSRSELQQLTRVRNVVRLGHVDRIEPDRVVLERGEIPTTPDHVHVHCAAPGLSDKPPKPIFTDETVTLQLVTRVGLTLSGALLGFLEAGGRTTQEKNDLCPPTSMPHTPFDYLRAVLAGIRTEMGWAAAPELQDLAGRFASEPSERLVRERGRTSPRGLAESPLHGAATGVRTVAGLRVEGHRAGEKTHVRTNHESQHLSRPGTRGTMR